MDIPVIEVLRDSVSRKGTSIDRRRLISQRRFNESGTLSPMHHSLTSRRAASADVPASTLSASATNSTSLAAGSPRAAAGSPRASRFWLGFASAGLSAAVLAACASGTKDASTQDASSSAANSAAMTAPANAAGAGSAAPSSSAPATGTASASATPATQPAAKPATKTVNKTVNTGASLFSDVTQPGKGTPKPRERATSPARVCRAGQMGSASEACATTPSPKKLRGRPRVWSMN